MEAFIQGPHGTAELMDIPVLPRAAELVCDWLIEAPDYHPFWVSYCLSVIRLTDGLPGFDAPHHAFEGTTHEMMVVALNPDEGPFNKEKIEGYYENGGLPFLTPVNVCEQFVATDEEMRELAYLGARAICLGVMSPEPPFDSASHSKNWLVAMTKTLAHIRGEHHAP